MAACAVGMLSSLGGRAADATEWRRAGAMAAGQGAVVQAQAIGEVDPFEDDDATGRAKPQAAGVSRSVVVRPEPGAPAGFDPFEEPNAEPAMPAAEPVADAAVEVAPREAGFNPFDADEETAARPELADERDVEVEADAVEGRDEASISQGDELSAGARGDLNIGGEGRDAGEQFDVAEAFGEPRRGVAVGPSVDEALEDAQGAVEEEIDRRDRGDDRDAGVTDEESEDPFTPDDALDAPDRDVDGSIEDSVESDSDNEFNADDLEEQFQQAPGGFEIRPMDTPPGTTDEQAARRREIENRQIEAERVKSAQTCEEFLANVRADDIRTVSLAIRLEGRPGEDYPFDCGLGEEKFKPRSWAQTTLLWKASGLCHKPLYFEQVQMERYGHSWGPVMDPLLSGAHFFGSVPLLPYKMGIMTPNECVYTLGYYRPGSCAPFMIEAVPFTWRAAAFEAGVFTGGAFAIP